MEMITIVSPDGEVKEMVNIKHIVAGYIDNGWAVRSDASAPSPPAAVGHPAPADTAAGGSVPKQPKPRARKTRKEG